MYENLKQLLVASILTTLISVALIHFNYHGPNDSDVQRIDEKINALVKRQSDIESSIQALSNKQSMNSINLDDVKRSLDEINNWMERKKGQDIARSTAYLDPRSQGYSHAVATDNSTFLFSVKSVKPYLDGLNVVLQIGNPQSVAYRMKKLHVTWGGSSKIAKGPDGKVSLTAGDTRSKDIEIPADIYPSRWNDVTFNISPVKNEEFDYLHVTPEFSSVHMQ